MHTLPPPDRLPDVYADQFTMSMSAYGAAITFALTPSTPSVAQPGLGTPQVVVRMSLEHLKVLAMLLRKNLKQYELEQLGDPVSIPRALLAQLGLSVEDW